MFRATVFDIPRKPQQLTSANNGCANAKYTPVCASKDVSGDQFTHGTHQFKFDASANTWFVPSKCYFRLRCSLTQVREDGGDPLPILVNGDVAPNMGLASNLFKAIEVKLNGKTIERIAERVPQIDALKTRTANTGAWLKTVGQATNFWAADFATRREQVAVDGYLAGSTANHAADGPVLTQVQAGFHEDHLIKYDADTFMLTFDENEQKGLDIMNGAMALREGDRLSHGNVVLDIHHIIDATHAFATYVKASDAGQAHIRDPDDEMSGLSGWHFQKLSHASTNDASGANEFEIVWRPPLGFFDVEHAIPPGGQWTLEFTPQNAFDLKRLAVETLGENARMMRQGQPTLQGDIDFQVNEFQMYVYNMESERFEQGSWFLDLEHTKCQLQHLPADSMGLVTRMFDVHARTDKLTLAFQDQHAGTDTRMSRSKFKISKAIPTGDIGRSSRGGQDLLLERFFIQYAREQKPSPDFDGCHEMHQGDSNTSGINYLTHRYADSLMQADLYHTDGGAESFQEWISRGPFYHFQWPKDAMNQSTRAAVSVKFAAPFAEDRQHQMMLFSQWRTAYRIVHRNGRIEIAAMNEL